MNQKKIIGIVGVLLVAILLNIYIFYVANQRVGDNVMLNVEITADKMNEYQLFYGKENWSLENMVSAKYEKAGEKSWLQFMMPCDLKGFRLDLGDSQSHHRISNLYVAYKNKKWEFDLSQVAASCMQEEMGNMIHSAQIGEGGNLEVVTEGNDGYIVLSMPDVYDTVTGMRRDSLRIRYGLVCILVDVFFLILLLHFNRCYDMARELYGSRKLIVKLARNDFKTRFAGSFFGIFWAFVQPVVTILIYWFVFTVGFRSAEQTDCPFALWLTAGMVPWFFFSDAWGGATNSLVEYSFLVKKVVFKISVLPIVKVMSALLVSLFFHLVMCVIFIANGYMPDGYMLQLLYYLICNFAFALSLAYITGSILPFFKDLSQIMNIILQVGVWLTPIMWNINILPQAWRWVMKINPMYYIVQGYRNAMSEKVWFWQDITWTIYFWGVVGALFVIGNILFKKMRPHFADVI